MDGYKTGGGEQKKQNRQSFRSDQSENWNCHVVGKGSYRRMGLEEEVEKAFSEHIQTEILI